MNERRTTMPRVMRTALSLTAMAVVALLAAGAALAGGAFAPTFPPDVGLTKFDTGQFTAQIVLDPNGPVSSGAPATPTGTFGTIVLTRLGVGSASATFR